MDSEQKKAFILLKLIIFSYHGLAGEEKSVLEETADNLEAKEELNWALEFVREDPYSSFDRAREFFNKTIATYDKDTRLSYLNTVWEATNEKGYISEMEAMALLKLAKDWAVQKELLTLVKK